MALPVGCSRSGDTSLQRRRAASGGKLRAGPDCRARAVAATTGEPDRAAPAQTRLLEMALPGEGLAG